MNKNIVVVAAFFVMCAAYTTLAASRFYTGIGIQVIEMSDSIRSIHSADGGYSNSHGQLTGHLMIMGVLSGSTAEKAGLKFGNLVLAVDGKDAGSLRKIGVFNAIESGAVGSVVVLKIRRIAHDGTPLEEVDIVVERETVDRARWLPMDTVLGGGTSGADGNIAVQSKFTEDATEGVFTFWYRVHNRDDKDIFLQWDVLDCAAGLGRHKSMLLVPLSGGEAKEFTLKTSNVLAPEHGHGVVRVLVRTSTHMTEHYAKKNFFTPEGGMFTTSLATSMFAFIPEGWMEECER